MTVCHLMTLVQVIFTCTSYVSILFCYFLLLFATFFTLFTFDQFFRLIIIKKSDPKWSSSCLKYSSSTVEMVTNEPKWLQVQSSVIFDQLIYYMIIIFTVPHHTIQGHYILHASIEAPATHPSLHPSHICPCTCCASILVPIVCLSHAHCASIIVPAAHPLLYLPHVRHCACHVAVLYPLHGCLVPIVRLLLCPSRAYCCVCHVPVIASCVCGAFIIASCVRCASVIASYVCCASVIASYVCCASVIAPSLDPSCVHHWVHRASVVESVMCPLLRLSWPCHCIHHASVVVLAMRPSLHPSLHPLCMHPHICCHICISQIMTNCEGV